MSDAPGNADQNPNQPLPQAQFDPTAGHQNKPKLRRVRGFPLQAKGPNGEPATMLGLADAQQISPKMVATLPAVQTVLPHMDGSRSLDEIVAAVGRGLTLEFLQNLVAQLDDAGLLEGPTFDAMLDEMRAQFDAADTLPPGTTAQVADALVMAELGEEATEEQKAEMGPAKLREAMDKWIDSALKDVEDPAFDSLPAVVVAPHIDYPRGWVNYGHVYGRLRVTDRPDRIVVLGTNHFGRSTGICICDKGFESPIGTSPLDTAMLAALRGKLGEEAAEKGLAERYDHEREHSIELHVPWIQHCIGPNDAGEHCPILGVLIHDPTVNGGASYDDQGLDIDTFVEALKAAIAEVGGTTLIISSADLSHVGPAFGDQQPLMGEGPEVEEARNKVARHDQDMLKVVAENKPDDLISQMTWQQNPTRWCSIGNMVAAMRVAEPSEVRILNYGAALDPQGMSMVSHAAIAMR